MTQVTLNHVSKSWDNFVAVDDAHVEIEDGEFIAILGPSGCGKSTTLFMLAGIYLPTSGEILFDGENINYVEPRDRNVGIVFQSYALYPNKTTLENILFPLRFQKISGSEAEKRARAMAELMEIELLLYRKPSEMSGGQQQRVALARALVKRPNLLLLDEPLSNLDATLRLTMRTEIRRIQKELGVTTLLVTHDQIEATTMSDRIICMNSGRIEQVGTPDEIYTRPASQFVAGFVGSPPINQVFGMMKEGCFVVNNGVFPLQSIATSASAATKAAVLGIRPEHITVADKGIPATVTTVEPMGRETLIWTKTSLGVLRFLVPQANSAYRVNDQLKLAITPENTLLFDEKSGIRLADTHIQINKKETFV